MTTSIIIAFCSLLLLSYVFAIVPEQGISIVNKSLIIQTIILSALVMMYGLMAGNKKETTIEENVE